jgi:hypothetical protein
VSRGEDLGEGGASHFLVIVVVVVVASRAGAVHGVIGVSGQEHFHQLHSEAGVGEEGQEHALQESDERAGDHDVEGEREQHRRQPVHSDILAGVTFPNQGKKKDTKSGKRI